MVCFFVIKMTISSIELQIALESKRRGDHAPDLILSDGYGFNEQTGEIRLVGGEKHVFSFFDLDPEGKIEQIHDESRDFYILFFVLNGFGRLSSGDDVDNVANSLYNLNPSSNLNFDFTNASLFAQDSISGEKVKIEGLIVPPFVSYDFEFYKNSDNPSDVFGIIIA